jgi:hypothetical protein
MSLVEGCGHAEIILINDPGRELILKGTGKAGVLIHGYYF